MLNGYFVNLHENIADNPLKMNTKKEANMCIGSLFSVNIPTPIADNAAIVNKIVTILKWKACCKKYIPIIDSNPKMKIDMLKTIDEGPIPKSLI